MPIKVVAGQTQREPDGLAMSSRNRYLSNQDRHKAVKLSQVLGSMQEMAAGGGINAEILKTTALKQLADAGIMPEYLEIRHARSLKTKRILSRDQQIRVFIAATVGKTRLIDNMPLPVNTAPEDMGEKS
jgi:pantoate--beta-alanine ligase